MDPMFEVCDIIEQMSIPEAIERVKNGPRLVSGVDKTIVYIKDNVVYILRDKPS